jgi:hypothetical protein
MPEPSMKKQVKKLVLSKETLRNLEKGELERVAGEASAACTDTNCCSGVATCATCNHNTCGSRLC